MLYITFCRYLAVGGVGVGGADVAVLAVELADVLGEVPAVGVPGAVELDSQRTGGDGLSRIPCDIPQGRVVAAGEVNAGDLQIAPVSITPKSNDIKLEPGDQLIRNFGYSATF